MSVWGKNWGDPLRWVLLSCLLVLASACRKAPLFDVGAWFDRADTVWFEAEQTLFIFYEVQAQQGLGDPSVIEIRYTTDEGTSPWTVLTTLPAVHTHLEVDCGYQALCGSYSLHIPQEPRDVHLRLRYHREGEMAVEPGTAFQVVGEGPPHSHRSFLVYGVFDEANEHIQWRGRHRFPFLRNEEAEALGLRRHFRVEEPLYGPQPFTSARNPYGYGVTCPEDFIPGGLSPIETQERAIFHPDPLPTEAASAPTVCAQSTVTDALGDYVATAVARKNPEVRPAFPTLRSPIYEATPIRFFLGPCERTVSAPHEAMQRQRLQMEDVPTTCTDGFQHPSFVNTLVNLFRDAVEAERPQGGDMVLVIAVHDDEDGIAETVEDALVQVVPGERHRTSPRLAGAFVLHSEIRGLALPELAPSTLWCPSKPFSTAPDASSRSCATLPDLLELQLGPLSFGLLPILPSKDQYLEFIDNYSVRRSGRVEELAFLTPEFATTSDHIDLGPFGVITFLNGEIISADASDAFSWCPTDDPSFVAFRSPLLQQLHQSDLSCQELGLPEEVCLGALPLERLPQWHNVLREPGYELGIHWEFPFLLRMEYEVPVAGAVSAFGLSVPFGVASIDESYYGTEVWTQDEWPLGDRLTQCGRFCDHPTFDSAGVYRVLDTFRDAWENDCYRPRYPQIGDSGFPRDP